MRLDDWVNSLPDEPEKPLDIRIKLIVASSPPRTKKNHPVLVRNVTDSVLCKMIQEWEENRPEPPRSMGKVEPIAEATVKAFLENRDTQLPHPRLFPSPQYQEWHRKAVAEMLPKVQELKPYLPITCAVHCWVQIYRERDTGDKIGYLQGVYDWLQDMGILSDDRQVLSDDGSRMHTDVESPRVELVISPFVREGSMGLFLKTAKEWAQHEEPEPTDCVEADDQRMGRLTDEAREMLEQREEPEAAGSRLTLFSRYSR